MSKYRFSHSERFAVWKTYGYRCFWCREPIEFKETTVDHVIAESVEENLDELSKIKAHYGLPEDFQVNSYENWVPAHSGCNSLKGETVYASSPAMIAVLDKVQKQAPEARKAQESIERQVRSGRLLAKVGTALETEELSKDDLMSLFRATSPPPGASETDPQILKEPILRVSAERWTVVDSARAGMAMVTDGKMVGMTPLSAEADITWMCPTCGSYGPWNGVICLSCGRKSDPWD